MGEEEPEFPPKPSKARNRTVMGFAAIIAVSIVLSLLVAYHVGFFGTVDKTVPWDSHRLEGPWLVTEGGGEPTNVTLIVYNVSQPFDNVTLVVYTNGTINEWGIENPFNRSARG